MTITVRGTATPSNGSQTVSVELYTVDVNASGYGNGTYYLGTTTADSNGRWSYMVNASNDSCFTALQTIYVPGNFTHTSSEFSANSCRLFLPIITR